jgi:hypothetical protein
MFSARIDFPLHDQIVNINLTYCVLRSALAAKSFGIYNDFSTTPISFEWFKHVDRLQMRSFNPRKLFQKGRSNRVGKDIHSLPGKNLNKKCLIINAINKINNAVQALFLRKIYDCMGKYMLMQVT